MNDWPASWSCATKYRFPDGRRVIIRADLAWCRGCRDFALVERLLTAEELEKEAEEWFYLKYPEERTPYMQRWMREAMVARQKSNVERYRALLDYLPHRLSPPRCLTCGGTSSASTIPDAGSTTPSGPESFASPAGATSTMPRARSTTPRAADSRYRRAASF